MLQFDSTGGRRDDENFAIWFMVSTFCTSVCGKQVFSCILHVKTKFEGSLITLITLQYYLAGNGKAILKVQLQI